jgi:CRISPR-associated protein Cas7/Cst2/DevR subtype I-B
MSYLAGKLVIEVREGAPNNAMPDEAQVGRVKQIRLGSGRDSRLYPYIAPQAYRRWLRDTLTAGSEASPVFRSGSGAKQQAYTAGEPHRYIDDDLFGYMRALKGVPQEQQTYRDSVLSVGTLRAVCPARPTEDFGTMSRGFAADENPVIHRHEFYTADMAADLLIDVAHIGVFTLGGAGHRRSLTDEQVREALEEGARRGRFRGIDAVALPLQARRERLAKLLAAMASVRGGAKQALHYGDRTPALLVLVPMRGGISPLGRVVADRGGTTEVRAEVLRAELDGWAEELLGPVWLGWAPGYLADQRDRVAAGLADLVEAGRVVLDHPRTLLLTLAKEVHAGEHDDWFTDPVWAA